MARTVRKSLTPQEKKRKLLYTILWIIGGLVVVVIAAGVLVLVQLNGKPPLPPDVARGVEEGAQMSSAVVDAVGLRQAIASGQRRAINMDMTNADLAALMLQMGGGSEELRGMEVLLGDRRALVRGQIAHNGKAYNMQATLALQPEGGSIRATLGDLWIGNFRAPAAVKKKLQEEIDANLAKHPAQSLGIYVEQIEIRPGHAVLKGYTIGR
ncbi:MAG TPA: hypothetical protein DGT21_03160 [Armatimonadetes bacterium]|jgi:hypothetical protein|nr:hypothetical protein [Armatimonadota bacterium]